MRKVLLQLDTDEHPSPFDAIVAHDAGVDVLLSHGSVKPEAVRGLVQDALLQRGHRGHTFLAQSGADPPLEALRRVAAKVVGREAEDSLEQQVDLDPLDLRRAAAAGRCGHARPS